MSEENLNTDITVSEETEDNTDNSEYEQMTSADIPETNEAEPESSEEENVQISSVSENVSKSVPEEGTAYADKIPETVPVIPEQRTAEEIYSYDIPDDEPVDDRDLYYDFMPKEKDSVPYDSSNKRTAEPYKDVHGGNMISQKRENTVANEPPLPENHIKINRIYFVNTVISMITLCVTAAAIFTGYAYIHSLEQDLGISKRRLTELEDREDISDRSGSDEEDGDYIDAISLIDEEERNEPSVPVSEDVDIENGKLLLYDSYVGYSWIPVLSGVKPNEYSQEDFHMNSNGRMEYIKDGEVSSYFGIDVSMFQGDIDWYAARADGVEFAILRIGVRGYGEEGNIRLDDKFVENYEQAHDAGIDLGVYFYSQAISVEEAVEEANFVLEHLEGRTLEYPVVFDWEPVDTSTAEGTPRTEDVMPGTLTLGAIAFCETIRDAGYDAMIYTNKKMAYIKYDMRRLAGYPVWLALYSDKMTYYYDFDMWQYGYGEVEGIEGDVDLDIAIIR